MSEMPLFSVIITNFNKGPEIADAITSAQEQGAGVEVVVVDDCSTDGSRELLAGLGVQKLILNARNSGALESYLAGLRAARGKYLVMLDGDDRLAPGILNGLSGSDALDAQSILRLSMKPQAIGKEQDKPVTKVSTSFRLRPGSLLAATQSSGGAAFILPADVFHEVDRMINFERPDISVQDHVLPALLSLRAAGFTKMKTVGYYWKDDPEAPSLSKLKPRLVRDRLISDKFVLDCASKGPMRQRAATRVLLWLAYHKRLRKTARFVGIAVPSVLKMLTAPAGVRSLHDACLSGLAVR